MIALRRILVVKQPNAMSVTNLKYLICTVKRWLVAGFEDRSRAKDIAMVPLKINLQADNNDAWVELTVKLAPQISAEILKK